MGDLKTLDTQRAINLLCQMYLPCFDEEEWCALHTAIVALEEKKERERKPTNNGCGFDVMSDYSLYLNG